MSENTFRIGLGVDSHRLLAVGVQPEKKLILGGVHIPDHAGVDSHSDGDLILHALFNALSSAIGEKSIGQFFPDNDEKWKGADSSKMIAQVLKLVREKGYRIGNVVFSLECKTPKIAPCELAIKQSVVKLLEIPLDCIAVHATSGEKLTAFGKGEGIYCQATILLHK